MIREVGGGGGVAAPARAGIEAAHDLGGVEGFVRDDDRVEHGVVARAAPSRSWAPRAGLDDATAEALRAQIAVGIARLIVG